ncbi:hypothetical protein [Roseibium aestuarii]|uniref:Uncharacterized protein n=1 Tax=Roseibium aestuarii TaxID=2600299 RepID=A0ABW4JYH7_9HYPH|nr:hypothetical protein [Roseibium aestuarii]
MSARYPFDPFAMPERPDVPFPAARIDRAASSLPMTRRLARLGLRAVSLVGLIAGLSVLIFLPALVSELARIEAVTVEGQTYSASAFVEALGSLYLGSVIVAIALTSFLAAAALARPDLDPALGRWMSAPAADARGEHRLSSLRRKVTHV